MRSLAVSALILALSTPVLAQTTDAPKSDAKAACQGSDAKSAKACAPAKPRRKKPAADDGLKAQSFTRCRDVRTHGPTKCGGPYAEPLPTD